MRRRAWSVAKKKPEALGTLGLVVR